MLHYLLHASTVPWQDQLLYAGVILLATALVFGGFWWRRRAARPRQGDFAALVGKHNIAQALAAQADSPLKDAADAWQQTRHTMEQVRSGVERSIALILALLSGVLCAISVSAVISDVSHFQVVDWSLFAFYAGLGGVCAWFTRVQWRSFRGQR